MKRREMLKLIEDLSCSNGSYGRLLAQLLTLTEEAFNELMCEWESHHFKDNLAFIEFLEC